MELFAFLCWVWIIATDASLTMDTKDSSEQALFDDVVQGLTNGDFSRLEPVFAQRSVEDPRLSIVRWCEEGRFSNQPVALAEALTCACFLGRTDVADYLLRQGVNPAGGAGTGLNAFHWAANRGQVEAVRLLLRWNAPLGTRSMHGGNVLDTAVWSAINEPRQGQREIIKDLLAAGACLEDEDYPTGHEEIDALLCQQRAV